MNAGIAQLVEHDLAKVGVASSSLVSRSATRVVTSSLCCMPCRRFPLDGEAFFIDVSILFSGNFQ